jgi:hypothetical protein
MATSTHDDICEAVRRKLIGLRLSGIAPACIKLGKVASDRPNLLPALPGILVCPFGNAAPAPGEGTNERDDIPYRVLVAVIAPGNQTQEDHRQRMLIWMDTIQKKFRHQRLPGVTNVHTCFVETDTRFDPKMFAKNLDASVIVFRFPTREARG